MSELEALLRDLSGHYRELGWWSTRRGFTPRELEIVVGAVLTQNTSWTNVEKALDSMVENRCTNIRSILYSHRGRLERIIHSAGFHKQKTEHLKELVRFVSSFGAFRQFAKGVSREELLGVRGIGPETADSILLYACNRPSFVVDAYTRRILERTGITRGRKSYQELKDILENAVPRNAGTYREYHAAIVEHAKRHCRKKPVCRGCPLAHRCSYRKK